MFTLGSLPWRLAIRCLVLEFSVSWAELLEMFSHLSPAHSFLFVWGLSYLFVVVFVFELWFCYITCLTWKPWSCFLCLSVLGPQILDLTPGTDTWIWHLFASNFCPLPSFSISKYIFTLWVYLSLNDLSLLWVRLSVTSNTCEWVMARGFTIGVAQADLRLSEAFLRGFSSAETTGMPTRRCPCILCVSILAFESSPQISELWVIN